MPEINTDRLVDSIDPNYLAGWIAFRLRSGGVFDAADLQRAAAAYATSTAKAWNDRTRVAS